MQASPPTYPNCGADGSALRSPAQSVFTPTTGTIGEINGLVEDSNRPCRIYATSVDAPDAGYRVVRVEGVSAGNSCTGPWVAQPIAGLPNTPDGLPNMLNGQSFGLHRWAVAVDTLTETVVYVGTYAGLYQGQNVSGSWRWSRVLDVHDILVVDVKAQVNAAGPFGTLYAATFGRGAYERVVEIDYQYNGAHGAAVRVRPNVLVNGELSPYFIREIRDVATGTVTPPFGLPQIQLSSAMITDRFLLRYCPATRKLARPNTTSWTGR